MTGSDTEALLCEIAADRKLAPVYDYWRTLAGDGIPAFSRFDPAGVPASALGYLTLLDVIGGGRDFRVRLVGSGTLAAVGSNATGKTLDDAGAGEILRVALMRYRAVLLYRRPVADIVEYALGTGASIKTRLLTLPFSVDGLLVDRLLGIYSPVPAHRAPNILRNLVVPLNTHVHRSQAVL